MIGKCERTPKHYLFLPPSPFILNVGTYILGLMTKNNIDNGGRGKATEKVHRCAVLYHKSIFATIFVKDDSTKNI